ncbi:MAG: hypothetical protein LJE96_11355 [Deltaproteobacteria bacterium]|nr:hypothetical protein [Deltaproteobacteria bacterium]
MGRKIYTIVLIVSVLLFSTPILKLSFGNANQQDTSGVTIASNKTIFTPDDTMRISISVKASRIQVSVVDAYVVVQDPNGDFSILYEKPEWIVEDKPLYEVASIPLKNRQVGPYSWYFVLCPPGNDPFDLNGLVAVANIELFLLPNAESSPDKKNQKRLHFRSYPTTLIAHAGGEIGGRVGQNSLEALDRNYAKGHRYFEIDFCWTSDDRLVLIHDWERSFSELFGDAKEKPSLERFKSMKMKHGMTQMSLASLFLWLSKHNDAHIITDVKERNLSALKIIARDSGKFQKHFIPQIYDPSEFEPVKLLGFEKVILTLYRSSLSDSEVLKFAANSNLFAVTMPVRRAFSSCLLRELSQKGIPLYAHTVNEIEILNYLRGKGIHGIYTDKILPEDLNH